MKNRRWLWTALFCLTVLTVHADKRYALGSLNLKLMTCGFGNCRANKSVDNNALRLNGKTYETGVGTHADSRLKIWVNGTGKRFSAIVGVDDEATERGSVQFRVTGDGKVLAESPVMKKAAYRSKSTSALQISTLFVWKPWPRMTATTTIMPTGPMPGWKWQRGTSGHPFIRCY